MPSSSVSGWSSETSRLKIGFSQMVRPTPWPYWSANAASSSRNPNSCAVGHSSTMSAVVAPGRTGAMASVHVLAAPGVGVAHRGRGAAHGEAPVVAGAVAEVAVQDVEERRVAGPDDAVAVDVRVRRAPLAGDRVDPLDVLAAEVVEHLADQADALVLPDSRTQEAVQLLVRRVDHRAGLGEQADLVRRLDAARLEEHLLAVDHLDALRAQRRRGSASRRGPHPSGSPARSCSRSTVATLRATSWATPASGWKAPRSVEMPARARWSPSSQGLNSWWCLAAEPKSQSTGSPPRGRTANRISLSMAQVPMWVAVR